MAAIVLISEVPKTVAFAIGPVPRSLIHIDLSAFLQLQHSAINRLNQFCHLCFADGAFLGTAVQKAHALLAQKSFHWQLIAMVMMLLTLPLIVDLAMCVTGNLRHPSMARKAKTNDVRLAVVVPAHNQEPVIAETLQSLETAGCSFYVSSATDTSTSTTWQVQVFVVAHNCSDWTAAVAAGCGARVVALKDEERQSRSAALCQGFEAAQSAGANAFLVVNADSRVGPNLIAATRAAIAGGGIATQCRVELEIPSGDPVGLKARLHVIASRARNVLRARGRAGLGFSAGVFDNGFAITADALNRVAFEADGLYGNLEYHAKLVSAGIRVRWVDHAFVFVPFKSFESAKAAAQARLLSRFQVVSRVTGPLLMALPRGQWRAAAVLTEAWSLPIFTAVLATMATAFMPLHRAHVFTIATAVILLICAMEAVLLGPEPWKDLSAPFAAAARHFRKLPIRIAALRRARKDAQWARAHREARQP